MRIMTHNIWGDYYGNTVSERIDDILCVYQKYTPDVIGFQEVTQSWCESELFSRLSDDYNFVGIDRFYSYNFVPIAFKKDFELVAKGFERLQGVPSQSKSISWAVLKRPDGRMFGICNAHFWYMCGSEPEENKKRLSKIFGDIVFFTSDQHENVRKNNARQLIDLMRQISVKYGCTVFGMGDMNCTVKSPVFEDVCKFEKIPHLYDLAKEKDDICSIRNYPVKTADGKWHGEYPNNDHTESIDHIIACGEDFEVKSYRTVTDRAALNCSDHSCVFADIEFVQKSL